MRGNARHGFTLIELSIVLVIIGLIVGGVLVGRDLIHAAEIRATIAQIEKYSSAVNAFRSKYNYLPGDLPAQDAVNLGFNARTGAAGDGDGNGLVEGLGYEGNLGGETVFFWTDLSSAQMIDRNFSDSTDAGITANSAVEIAKYLPRAKVGDGAFIAALSNLPVGVTGTYAGIPNYSGLAFMIGHLTSVVAGDAQLRNGSLTTVDAMSIDTKIDDGSPISGRVVPGGGTACGPPACDTVTGSLGDSFFGGLPVGSMAVLAGTTDGWCVSNAVPTALAYNVAYPTNPACNLLVGR